MGYFRQMVGILFLLMVICGSYNAVCFEFDESSTIIREDIVVIWDIEEKAVRQGEKIHIEILVININDFNISFMSVSWNFDWFIDSPECPSNSFRNNTWYYYTHPYNLRENMSIPAFGYAKYFIEIEIPTNVTIGHHEYHFKCIFMEEEPPDYDGGAIPSHPILRSDIFSDFQVLERDSDNDGVPDSLDRFPNDSNESSDRDFDGIGDNSDIFPDQSHEWIDSDIDGIGDNSDEFPHNPAEWNDIDKDGVGDNEDAFPFDVSASIDTDSDGHPDRWNEGMSSGNSTMDLSLDEYPYDPEKWEDSGINGEKLIFFSILIIIVMLVSILVGFVIYDKKKGLR